MLEFLHSEKFYFEHPWRFLGLRFCLYKEKQLTFQFRGLIKPQLGKYLLFTLSRDWSLGYSLLSDIALPRMARRHGSQCPGSLTLRNEVWVSSSCASAVSATLPFKDTFFFFPSYSSWKHKSGTKAQINSRNSNICLFRHLSTKEKGLK